MASTASKIALGLGIPGCLLGAWILQHIYRFYRPQDLPVVAVPIAAVIVLALGLAGVRGKRAGAIALVLGGAVIGAAMYFGKHRDERQLAEIRHELGIERAAAAVCEGTPNAAAEPARGKRKLLQASKWETTAGYGAGPWEGFPAPSSLAELQLVACRVGIERGTTSCSYDNKHGGTYTIYKHQKVEILTVRDAKTAEVLGEKTFEGEPPSDRCDESISVPRYETSRNVGGMSPDRAAQAAWVQTFVAPAEN